MKRQQHSTDALVYAYGAVAPNANAHVAQELEGQRQFWNALVEADRAHEAVIHATMSRDSADYAAASRELDAAQESVREVIEARNAERARTRTRATSMDAAVKAAIATRNEARKRLWAEAAAWRKTHAPQAKALEATRRARNAELRRASGLYWGNYNRVLDAFERARGAARKKGRRVQEKAPQGEGVLTVQIQRTRSGLGAAPHELHDGSVSGLRLGTPPTGVEHLPATRRSRECRVTATMRVDAAGNACSFPVWLHRPLPPHARVKSAQLVMRSDEARLCLTVSTPTQLVAHSATSACGVDLGWRLEDDGALRVATVVDTSGAVTVYRLDRQWMEGMDRVERISTYIDDGLLELAQELQGAEGLPEPVAQALARWRPGLGARHVDADALYRYIKPLRDERKALPAALLRWYKRYDHLLRYRDPLRKKLIRRRRERYRLIARDIAKAHAVIGLEDMDLSAMARTKKRPDATPPELHAAARAQRVRAAVSDLRAEIEHQARKHGAQLAYATAHTTTRCHACGQVTGQGDRLALHWTCEHCAARWDQDANAARNLRDAASGAVMGAAEDGASSTCAPIVARIKDRSHGRGASPL